MLQFIHGYQVNKPRRVDSDTLHYDGSGCGDDDSDVNISKVSDFTTVVVLLVRVWATSCCLSSSCAWQCCLCLRHWHLVLSPPPLPQQSLLVYSPNHVLDLQLPYGVPSRASPRPSLVDPMGCNRW